MTLRPRAIGGLLLAGYLILVGVLTLTPTPKELEPNLVPLAGIAATFAGAGVAFGIAQLVGNLVLLLPFGALLRYLLPDTRDVWIVLAGLVLSVLIELAQWQIVAGRMADIDDVWLNTLGCAIGVWGARRLLPKG